MWNFIKKKLPEERSRMWFYLIYFPQGRFYRLSGPRILLEGSFKRKLKVLVPFLGDQKDWRAIGPLPRSFSPQKHPIKKKKKLKKQQQTNTLPWSFFSQKNRLDRSLSNIMVLWSAVFDVILFINVRLALWGTLFSWKQGEFSQARSFEWLTVKLMTLIYLELA